MNVVKNNFFFNIYRNLGRNFLSENMKLISRNVILKFHYFSCHGIGEGGIVCSCGWRITLPLKQLLTSRKIKLVECAAEYIQRTILFVKIEKPI